MAQAYWFRLLDDTNSTTILPVAGDPTYDITEMDLAFSVGNTVVQFTDSDGTPVTPTGGTVQFQSGPIEGQWLAPPTVVTINATDVIAAADGTALYTLPSFDGPVEASRMIVSGITGATHVRAFHWRAR